MYICICWVRFVHQIPENRHGYVIVMFHSLSLGKELLKLLRYTCIQQLHWSYNIADWMSSKKKFALNLVVYIIIRFLSMIYIYIYNYRRYVKSFRVCRDVIGTRKVSVNSVSFMSSMTSLIPIGMNSLLLTSAPFVFPWSDCAKYIISIFRYACTRKR